MRTGVTLRNFHRINDNYIRVLRTRNPDHHAIVGNAESAIAAGRGLPEDRPTPNYRPFEPTGPSGSTARSSSAMHTPTKAVARMSSRAERRRARAAVRMPRIASM